jgi:hypothetical protein
MFSRSSCLAPRKHCALREAVCALLYVGAEEPDAELGDARQQDLKVGADGLEVVPVTHALKKKKKKKKTRETVSKQTCHTLLVARALRRDERPADKQFKRRRAG